MFGLNKKTLLYKDIIETLNADSKALSIEEIKNTIGYGSSTTILTACKDLITIIDDQDTTAQGTYSLKMEFNSRGKIVFNRYSTNLQSLHKEIFSKDLAYILLIELIKNREFSTIKFCIDHGISISTLHRKIRAINQTLTKYQIHITTSNLTKFQASEIHIRIFSYIFFWSVHREFSTKTWNSNAAYFIDNAKKVLVHLDLVASPINFQSLALWLQLFSIGTSKNNYLGTEFTFDVFEKKVEMPVFLKKLKNWNETEWRALLVIMYISNNYFFDLPINDSNLSHQSTEVTVETFKACASIHFGAISSEKETLIQREISRYTILNTYIGQNAKKGINDITSHIISFSFLKRNFPKYWKAYARFWIEFKRHLSEPNRNSYLKYLCVTICLKIFPLDSFFSEVRLYLCSDIGELYENYLKQTILINLNSKYNLTFVKNYKNADIILSTVPINLSQIKIQKSKILVINSQLSERDLTSIDLFLMKQLK